MVDREAMKLDGGAETITRGNGNGFAELGYPDAD